MRSAICVVLAMLVPVACVETPIRIMGLLASSPPIAPHKYSFNPLVPCPDILEERCKGGYPGVSRWMTNLTANTRGTVKFVAPDFRSRTILAHPKEIMLNHDIWDRLGVDFVTMRNEHLMSSSNNETFIEAFFMPQRHPLVVTDFKIDGSYAFLAGLISMWHVKEVDGVKVAILVLWSDTFEGRAMDSIPHSRIVPVVTRRLRADGVAQIIVFRVGHTSSYEDEMTLLSSYDIDLVVTDLYTTGETFTRNGTTVMFATLLQEDSSSYPIVSVDLYAVGNTWHYKLEEIDTYARDVPNGRTDPLFLADAAWMQTQVDLGAANDFTLTTSTLPMPSPVPADGSTPCREEECEIGTLSADALLKVSGADLAFINGGAVRGSGWPAGDIRRSHMWDSYPFANTICTVNVTGSVLLDIINFGVSFLLEDGTDDPKNDAGLFPQLSGMRLSINLKLPLNKVTSIDVKGADGLFRPLEKRRTYSLALTSFIADGGDGYTMIPANMQAGSHHCLIDTVFESVVKHLMDAPTYEPHLNHYLTKGTVGTSLDVQNQTKADCTDEQKFDEIWQDCVTCPEGFWHPDPEAPHCVERAPGSTNIGLIIGIVIGILVVVGVPVAWKITEKQRRINALFNNNKIAEECAVAVMDLRLSDLDYLNELDKPNTIQSAFLSIVKQMKIYMEFMPKNLIANYQSSEEGSDAGETSDRRSGTFTGTHSINGDATTTAGSIRLSSRRSLEHLPNRRAKVSRTNYMRKKRVSILSLNSRSHTQLCASLDSEAVVQLHSYYIETFNCVVELNKGLAEPMCGDRLVAVWNTVSDRANHCVLACKAAIGLRKMKEHNITPHVGLGAGSALFGLFGGSGTKKYDLIGKVLPGAQLLMLLNKEYDTQALFPRSMVHEASTHFYVRIVDYIKHAKLPDTTFIYELVNEKQCAAHDEWMYEMEQADQRDPYFLANAEWKEFIKTGEISNNFEHLTGKLLQMKNDGVTGREYVYSCDSLELF